MIVTLTQLSRVHVRIQDELDRWGIFSRKLQKVECYLTYAPSLMGELAYFIEGTGTIDELVGFRAGHIYFPWLIGRGCLLRILRHEYGHAWAYHHPAQFDTRLFEQTFGADYWSDEPFDDLYCSQDFITPYASTNASEDFCETFAAFLTVKGKINRFSRRKGVYRKLKTVGQMINRAQY